MDRNSKEFTQALNDVLNEVKNTDFNVVDDSVETDTDGSTNYFVRIKVRKTVKRSLEMEIVVCSDGMIRFDLPKEMKNVIENWGDDFWEYVNIKKFHEIKNGFKKGVERGIFSGEREDFSVTFNMLYGLMSILATKK